MTKSDNARLNLKRCSCGAVVRGLQAKSHFKRDGHAVTQAVTACTSCEVVASEAELRSGCFRKAHQSCPILRANSGKVSRFMSRIKTGPIQERSGLEKSLAQPPVRVSSERVELDAAIRAILPSPIEVDTDDDVDLDRTPRAERAVSPPRNVIAVESDSSSSSSDDDDEAFLAPRLTDGALASSTPIVPASPRAVAAPAATPATSASGTDKTTAAAAGPSRAEGIFKVPSRPISQTTEVVLLQDRVRGLQSDLERLRKELAAKDNDRRVNTLQLQLASMEDECQRLRQENEEVGYALSLERDRSADFRDELERARRELAEAMTSQAAATPTAPVRATHVGRSHSVLLHVPTLNNEILEYAVSSHNANVSFVCPESAADGIHCTEILVTVAPNGDAQHVVFKRRRD